MITAVYSTDATGEAVADLRDEEERKPQRLTCDPGQPNAARRAVLAYWAHRFGPTRITPEPFNRAWQAGESR